MGGACRYLEVEEGWLLQVDKKRGTEAWNTVGY